MDQDNFVGICLIVCLLEERNIGLFVISFTVKYFEELHYCCKHACKQASPNNGKIQCSRITVGFARHVLKRLAFEVCNQL